MHTPNTLTAEEKNQCIAVPRKLIADDGREFHLREWTPTVAWNACIEVTIRAIVSLPEEK